MAASDNIRDIIPAALALAPRELYAALDMLEKRLEIARANKDPLEIKLLARNAGIVCSGFIGAEEALDYSGEALSVAPNDATALCLRRRLSPARE